MAYLQAGTAHFVEDDNLVRALPHWLRALAADHREHARLDVALERAAREAPDALSQALATLQRSWFAACAETARASYTVATMKQPKLHDVTRELLAAAAAVPAFSPSLQTLRLRVEGLLPELAQQQWQLVEALDAGRFVEAQTVAHALKQRCPHLLAPHCAEYICAFELGGGIAEGSAFEAQSVAHMRTAANIIAMGLLAEPAHELHAMGALSVAQHRRVWAAFLDRAYETEPTAFGASYGSDEVLLPMLPARRRVAGVPWLLALELRGA